MAAEYRVVWQREGQRKTRALYQTRRGAERFVLVLERRFQELTEDDPDAYACCPGRDCGCGGITNAEAWATDPQNAAPPIVFGPVIECRPVGDWALLPEGDEPA